MPGPKLVVLMRHGKSLSNELRTAGDPHFPPEHKGTLGNLSDKDVPLSPLGVSQAREEGIVIRDRFERYARFDVVYCSDMHRARQTAENLILPFHIEPMIIGTHLLNERDPGYTFGMTREESERHFPFLNEYWEREGWFYARPPGGESVADVATNRVTQFLETLFFEHEGQRILVVTHGRWIQAARVVIEHLSTRREVPYARNCGWLVYHSHPERYEFQLTNATNY